MSLTNRRICSRWSVAAATAHRPGLPEDRRVLGPARSAPDERLEQGDLGAERRVDGLGRGAGVGGDGRDRRARVAVLHEALPGRVEDPLARLLRAFAAAFRPVGAAGLDGLRHFDRVLLSSIQLYSDEKRNDDQIRTSSVRRDRRPAAHRRGLLAGPARRRRRARRATTSLEHQNFGPDHADGADGVKAVISSLRRAFSDFELTIEDLVVAGDVVWTRNVATGTNDGSFMGRPPTGRPMRIDVFDVLRVVDGKVVEHWGVPDRRRCSSARS